MSVNGWAGGVGPQEHLEITVRSSGNPVRIRNAGFMGSKVVINQIFIVFILMENLHSFETNLTWWLSFYSYLMQFFLFLMQNMKQRFSH